MEPAVKAYIERQSSVKLVSFLEICMLQNQWSQHAQIIPQILATLKSRDFRVSEQIVSSWEFFISTTQTNRND